MSLWLRGPRGYFRAAGTLTLLCGAASIGLAVATLRWGAGFGGILGRGEAMVKLHLLMLFAAGVTVLPLGVMTLAERTRGAVLAAVVEVGYAAWLFASTRHGLTFPLAGTLLCSAALCLVAAAKAPPTSQSAVP